VLQARTWRKRRIFPSLAPSGHFRLKCQVTRIFRQPSFRLCGQHFRKFNRRINMAERKRVRRNTLERRCLGKAFKRLFVTSPKGVFKMLEKIKRV
jgi:hypothetical protein